MTVPEHKSLAAQAWVINDIKFGIDEANGWARHASPCPCNVRQQGIDSH